MNGLRAYYFEGRFLSTRAESEVGGCCHDSFREFAEIYCTDDYWSIELWTSSFLDSFSGRYCSRT